MLVIDQERVATESITPAVTRRDAVTAERVNQGREQGTGLRSPAFAGPDNGLVEGVVVLQVEAEF